MLQGSSCDIRLACSFDANADLRSRSRAFPRSVASPDTSPEPALRPEETPEATEEDLTVTEELPPRPATVRLTRVLAPPVLLSVSLEPLRLTLRSLFAFVSRRLWRTGTHRCRLHLSPVRRRRRRIPGRSSPSLLRMWYVRTLFNRLPSLESELFALRLFLETRADFTSSPLRVLPPGETGHISRDCPTAQKKACYSCGADTRAPCFSLLSSFPSFSLARN